jgi:hypothetical protein
MLAMERVWPARHKQANKFFCLRAPLPLSWMQVERPCKPLSEVVARSFPDEPEAGIKR